MLRRIGRFLCAFCILLPALAAPAAPNLTFTSTGAIADGIRPGGDSIWFVHSVSDFSGSARLSRAVRVIRDDDGDGRVLLEAEVHPASVWAVVDYFSGDYAIASPAAGLPVQELRERGNGWAAGRANVDFSVSVLDVLVVRPGRGAWTVHCAQGSRCDGDGRPDANLRVRLSDMQPLHGGEVTPAAALPRDLMIAVHPRELWTFVRSAAEAKQ